MKWLVSFTVQVLRNLLMLAFAFLLSCGLSVAGYFFGMWFIGFGLPAQPTPEGLQFQQYVGVFIAGAFFAIGAGSPYIAYMTESDKA